MKNYYRILGIKRNASDDEIKQAYRKLALKYHPDRNFGDKAAEEKIKKINEAYEILGDNVKKASYDFDLRKEIEKQKEAKRKKEEKNRKRYAPPPVPDPEIVHFNANTSSFFNGDKITFSWYVKHADIIEILPFTGTFENRGVKTWKINNVRSRTLGITLVATNSKTNISTTNTIRLKRIVNTPPLADPSIEYFYANSKFFDSNDVITVSWKVNNVDHVEIEHFGTVNATGTKKLRLTNFKKAALSFDLFAKNTKTGKSIKKSIYLMANTLNDSYKYKPNIFSRISNQIQSIFDFNYNFRIKAPKINFKILSSFFSTKGYLNRAQYAIVFLSISVLFNLGLYLLAKINFFESDFNLYSYILFFIIITAIQTSKRIHDFDGNNLIMLLFFVPFGFPLLLIYLFAKPGYYA